MKIQLFSIAAVVPDIAMLEALNAFLSRYKIIHVHKELVRENDKKGLDNLACFVQNIIPFHSLNDYNELTQ